MTSLNVGKKIILYGTMAEVLGNKKILEGYPGLVEDRMTEADARKLIMSMIEGRTIKSEVVYDGNHVYNKARILKNVRLILESNDMSKMTDYLYDFLTMKCGSIAHYNKQGWIDTYPTPVDLKKFFQKNEFGVSVLQHQPRWSWDSIEIVKAIDELFARPGAVKLPRFKVTLWTPYAEWEDVEAEDEQAALRMCGYPPEFDGNDAHKWTAEKVEA